MTLSNADAEIEDRFFLNGRMEILSILNNLIHHGETITLTFDGGRDFIITTLLEARPEALIFDVASDAKANLSLQRCQQCVFSAAPDGIRVKFTCVKPQLFSWGGKRCILGAATGTYSANAA